MKWRAIGPPDWRPAVTLSPRPPLQFYLLSSDKMSSALSPLTTCVLFCDPFLLHPNGSETFKKMSTSQPGRFLGINPIVDISTAVRACDRDAVPGILKELSSFGNTPSVEHDDTRLRMLASAKALVRALETPRETMIKHNWAQVC